MDESRIILAKEEYQELVELTVKLELAYSLQHKYPKNHELKIIAEDLRQKALTLEEEFKEKYQDLIDAGNLL